jgi:hypothetical protein
MTYQTAHAEQAAELCRLGATDQELAEHFMVTVRTIYRWRAQHRDFAEAVIAGKEHADKRVERSLYSRAVGCSFEAVRVFKHAGDADPVYAAYRHSLPPSAGAALQWLRLRRPGKWIVREVKEEQSNAAEMIERARARVAAHKPVSD